MLTPYYSDDAVILYCGDMRDVLPELDIKPDLILTDPPYEETGLDWDKWPSGWLDAAAKVATSMWCFLPLRQFATPPFRGQEFAASGWRLSHDIEPGWDVEHDHVTWEKHNGSGRQTDRFRRVHEPVAHWYRGRWADVYRDVPLVPATVNRGGAVTRNGVIGHAGTYGEHTYVDNGMRLMRSVIHARSTHHSAIHRTEKPTELVVPLIRYGCPPGGLVLDTFAGSCVTGVAARLAGVRSVLIEREEEMCEKAVIHRLSRDAAPVRVRKPAGQGDLLDLFSVGDAA